MIGVEICKWFRRFAVIMRTYTLTFVTSINMFAEAWSTRGKFAAMLNAEIRKTAAGIKRAVGRYRATGTGTHTGATTATVADKRTVGRQLECRHELSQKDSRPYSGHDELSVEANEAQSGTVCPITLGYRGGVDTGPRLSAEIIGHKGGKLPQPTVKHCMIVTAESVISYPWMMISAARTVRESERYDRTCTGKQQTGIAAYGSMTGKVVHSAVGTRADPPVVAVGIRAVDRAGDRTSESYCAKSVRLGADAALIP